MILGTSGFVWPEAGERLVKELTEATTPRDKRDALRLLRVRAEQGAFRPAEPPAVLQALRTDREVDVRIDALRLWAVLAPEADVWTAALDDPAALVRLAATEALAGRVEPLVRALDDGDARVRAAALRGLATLPDPRVEKAALAALSDPELEVQVAAAGVLGAEPAARAALLARTDAAFPELRVAALDALARDDDASADGAFALALDDPDPAVVLAGLRALARRPARALPSRVYELARDDSLTREPSVSAAATALLARRGTRAVESEDAWLAPLTRTADELSIADSAHVLVELERALPRGATLASQPLLLWLPRAPATLRPRIAALIERTAGAVSGREVAALMRDPSAVRRAAYVRLFAQTDGEGLLACLEDRATEVRAAAIEALARSTDAGTWHALLDRLLAARGARHTELLRAFAREQRAWSLAERKPLRRDLERTCDAEDDAAAALALRALGQLDDERTRARIRDALSDARPGRRIAALRASIPDAGPQARALRLRASLADDVRVASTAVIALALAGDPMPRDTLISALRNARWPLGPSAAFALSTAAAGAFELCSLLDSPEPVTRLNVAWTVMQRSGDACRPQAIEHFNALTRALGALSASTAETPHMPRAVVLQDSRLIVSWPDASGLIDWPRVALVEHVNAWFIPYGS